VRCPTRIPFQKFWCPQQETWHAGVSTERNPANITLHNQSPERSMKPVDPAGIFAGQEKNSEIYSEFFEFDAEIVEFCPKHANWL
jgi:hypothetical protein